MGSESEDDVASEVKVVEADATMVLVRPSGDPSSEPVLAGAACWVGPASLHR